MLEWQKQNICTCNTFAIQKYSYKCHNAVYIVYDETFRIIFMQKNRECSVHSSERLEQSGILDILLRTLLLKDLFQNTLSGNWEYRVQNAIGDLSLWEYVNCCRYCTETMTENYTGIGPIYRLSSLIEHFLWCLQQMFLNIIILFLWRHLLYCEIFAIFIFFYDNWYLYWMVYNTSIKMSENQGV